MLAASLLCADAFALGLGRVRGAALIGRPVNLTVPITLDAGESEPCVAGELFQGDTRMGGVAMRLEPGQVRITSSAPLEEPVVTLYLRVGCGQQVTRRYVVLSEHPDENAAAVPPVAAPAPARAAVPVVPAVPVAPAPAPLRSEPVLRPRPQKPAKAPRAPRAEPTPAVQARLKVEPLDLSVDRSPTLHASTQLTQQEDAGKRAQAAALWQAINTAPEDLIRQAQRIETMEREMKSLREIVQQNTAALGQVGQQLQKARSERNWVSTVAMVLVAALLAAAIALVLQWRRRGAAPRSGRWWQERAEPPDTELPPELPTEVPSTAPAPVPRRSPAIAGWSPPREAAPPDFMPSQTSSMRMVKAEELIGIEEQAEFFVSIGQPQEAIRLLESHVHDHVETSAVAWLTLLDLHHELGQREDFERVRAEFHAQFNAQVPEFDAFSGGSAGLEDYRRALSRIIALWPNPKVLDVIEESLFRKPGTPGADPFDLEAYRDLLMLYNVAREIGEAERGESTAGSPLEYEDPSASRRAAPSDFSATNLHPLSASMGEFSSSMPASQIPPASPNVGVDIDLESLDAPPEETIVEKRRELPNLTFDFGSLPGPKRH